jgi:cell division protein FtsI/penicillin-binding protein 2
MVGIMDPKTGDIIAMASFPSFDPANYEDYSDDLFKNPFITDLYEPGSTVKPLIMAGALDAGLLKSDSRCPRCSGPISEGGYTIRTWNNEYYGSPTMTEVLIHSDNTGMVYVAQTLGLDRMISYLSKFRIGSLTGIDLQGEASATLKPKHEWYDVDLATAGFGQGISITPIQLLQAFSALANKGVIMQPKVVSFVINHDGKTVEVDDKQVSRPISEATAKIITEMLVQVVNKGEAQFARVKGYRIAGKTGTASIPIEGHYDPDQTIASFIGYAPADDPKFLMLVIFNRPKASIYGAETAAPVFFDIARNLLRYYQIPPTGE